MIIMKIHGGLGNQMFQYALGRNLSLLHGVPLKIDCSYLKIRNQSNRVLQLNGFKIQAVEATENEIKKYGSTFQKIADRIRPESKRKRALEQGGEFDSEILKRSDGYFDGHWQNELYFKAHEKTIREDFSLKNRFGPASEAMARKIQSEKNPTSVHIRRGDYVSIEKIADTHGTLPVSYYRTACDKILEKLPDARFFVSSDDIDWAKENFPREYPATFISAPEITDCEELTLMSLCKHNIIANSTFSWWGAWLNTNPEKIVIAPKLWFVNPNRVPKDLIPSSWIPLEAY